MNTSIKNLIKAVAILAAGALPFVSSAIFLGTTLNVTPTSPGVGSGVVASGTCGGGGSNAAVTFFLSRNGVNTDLSASPIADNTGYFTSTVVIPSDYGAGSAVLTAVCGRSGDTLNSTTLSIQAVPAANITSVDPSTAPINSTTIISGTCPAVLAGDSVNFTASQSGIIMTLPAVGTTIASNGNFSSGVGLSNPSLVPGSATVTANCPDGSSAATVVTLTAALPVVLPPVVTPTPTPPVSVTPVGGVAAGSGPVGLELLALAALLAGGFVIARFSINKFVRKA